MAGWRMVGGGETAAPAPKLLLHPSSEHFSERLFNWVIINVITWCLLSGFGTAFGWDYRDQNNEEFPRDFYQILDKRLKEMPIREMVPNETEEMATRFQADENGLKGMNSSVEENWSFLESGNMDFPHSYETKYIQVTGIINDFEKTDENALYGVKSVTFNIEEEEINLKMINHKEEIDTSNQESQTRISNENDFDMMNTMMEKDIFQNGATLHFYKNENGIEASTINSLDNIAPREESEIINKFINGEPLQPYKNDMEASTINSNENIASKVESEIINKLINVATLNFYKNDIEASTINTNDNVGPKVESEIINKFTNGATLHSYKNENDMEVSTFNSLDDNIGSKVESEIINQFINRATLHSYKNENDMEASTINSHNITPKEESEIKNKFINGATLHPYKKGFEASTMNSQNIGSKEEGGIRNKFLTVVKQNSYKNDLEASTMNSHNIGSKEGEIRNKFINRVTFPLDNNHFRASTFLSYYNPVIGNESEIINNDITNETPLSLAENFELSTFISSHNSTAAYESGMIYNALSNEFCSNKIDLLLQKLEDDYKVQNESKMYNLNNKSNVFDNVFKMNDVFQMDDGTSLKDRTSEYAVEIETTTASNYSIPEDEEPAETLDTEEEWTGVPESLEEGRTNWEKFGIELCNNISTSMKAQKEISLIPKFSSSTLSLGKISVESTTNAATALIKTCPTIPQSTLSFSSPLSLSSPTSLFSTSSFSSPSSLFSTSPFSSPSSHFSTSSFSSPSSLFSTSCFSSPSSLSSTSSTSSHSSTSSLFSTSSLSSSSSLSSTSSFSSSSSALITAKNTTTSSLNMSSTPLQERSSTMTTPSSFNNNTSTAASKTSTHHITPSTRGCESKLEDKLKSRCSLSQRRKALKTITNLLIYAKGNALSTTTKGENVTIKLITTPSNLLTTNNTLGERTVKPNNTKSDSKYLKLTSLKLDNTKQNTTLKSISTRNHLKNSTTKLKVRIPNLRFQLKRDERGCSRG